MVLELRGGGALDGPVARVVGAGGNFVHHQPPTGPEHLHREDTGRAGDLGHPAGQGAGFGGQVGVESSHQHLPADPVLLHGLHRIPGHRLPAGAAGHQHGELGVDGHPLLHQQLHPGLARPPAHRLGLGAVADRPDPFAVVTASHGLQHHRPPVLAGEPLDRGHGVLHPSGCSRRGQVGVGRDGHPGIVEAGPHPRLVDREPEGPGARAHHGALAGEELEEGEIDLLVVERHDVGTVGEQPQVLLDGGQAHQDLGRHLGRRVVGVGGEHHGPQPQAAGRFAGHAGQLAGAGDPHRSCPCAAGTASLGRIGHEGQTTGSGRGHGGTACASAP